MTLEEIVLRWKPFVRRGVGIKRAEQLVLAANESVGLTVGTTFAKRELASLLEQYDLYKQQVQSLDEDLEDMVRTLLKRLLQEEIYADDLALRLLQMNHTELGYLKQCIQDEKTLQ